MLPYSLHADADLRSRVHFILAVSAILTIIFARIVVTNLGTLVPSWSIDWISLPSAFGVFLLYLNLFDGYIWRWHFIRTLHGVPDLNGTWAGIMRRSDATGEVEEHTAKATITQTWNRIEVEYEGHNTYSRIISFALYVSGKSRPEIIYTYRIAPKEI